MKHYLIAYILLNSFPLLANFEINSLKFKINHDSLRADYYRKNLFNLTVIGTQHVNMKDIRIGYERRIEDEIGYEANIGYIYYLFEEDTKVRGVYFDFSLNNYITDEEKRKHRVKLMPFYNYINLNDYLKYKSFSPALGEYTEYRKTNYQKTRYGFNIVSSWQLFWGNGIFSEVNCGIGIIRFTTKVPNDVVQKTFRNGLFYGKEYTSPNVLLNIKIGFGF